uniref:Uncharacterized protein n=1 Tax=blood disease bacterium R229 TaxID=741978 RepID=G2ZM67_9RALS|nr:hypothetical protein BDB_80574 [blood disease bacterium R229]
MKRINRRMGNKLGTIAIQDGNPPHAGTSQAHPDW